MVKMSRGFCRSHLHRELTLANLLQTQYSHMRQGGPAEAPDEKSRTALSAARLKRPRGLLSRCARVRAIWPRSAVYEWSAGGPYSAHKDELGWKGGLVCCDKDGSTCGDDSFTPLQLQGPAQRLPLYTCPPSIQEICLFKTSATYPLSLFISPSPDPTCLTLPYHPSTSFNLTCSDGQVVLALASFW